MLGSDKQQMRSFCLLAIQFYVVRLRFVCVLCQRLYSLGARKVAVFGVGLIGQTPELVRRFGNDSSTVTATAQLFSDKLLPLVNHLNSQLSGARFTYINTTGIYITSASSLGT